MRLGLGLGLGLARLRGSSIDPAAAAYFAATGLTGATEKAAVNTLVRSLKSAGLWSKMKAVYPFVTDNRNLLGYTNNWTNAIWQGSSVTTDQADPFGGTNAILCSVEKWQSFSYTTLTQYTISIYAKANTSSIFTLGSDSTLNYYSTFNLSTQTVVNSTGYSGLITSIGNGWYRCSVTWTKDSGGALTQPFYDFKPTGGSMYFYGPQLELGSTATTYQPIATTQQSYISNQFKYNLVNPVDSDAAFRLVFNGGWTMSAQGATPNGTNAWGDTKLPNNTMSQNSMTMCTYLRTDTLQTLGDLGVWSGGFGSIIYSRDGLGFYSGINNSTSANKVGVLNANSLGFFLNKRTSATEIVLQKNATQTTLASNSQNLLTSNFIIARTGDYAGEYSNRQTAFVGIGDGISNSEATALYNAVQTMNTTLQRQV